MGLADDAQQIADSRPRPRQIDYARMRQVWPRQKAALTRAGKLPEGQRADKVTQVCRDAVKVWDEIGAWPDDWSLFQRALDDALGWHSTVRLEDLRQL